MNVLSKILIFALLFFCASPLFFANAKAEASRFTDEMVERSLVSVGNTERFHAACEKARAGETVTLAYLGGSITEGALAQPQKTACYASVSCRIFAEKYAKNPENVKYVNAGISGTPSLLGITRLEQDILSKNPDIVFVEFAVNDSIDPLSKKVYESLIARLLNSETAPAVVLLFTVMESGYTAQEHMQAIGAHYDLGMISVKNAIQPEIKAGRMTFQDYSSDYTHPTTEGHAFIADMIAYYFDCAYAAAPSPYAAPEKALYGTPFQKLINIRRDSELIETTGSFLKGVYPCYTYIHGWKHEAGWGNAPFQLTVPSKTMIIAYKQENNPDCGTLEVLCDGIVVKTLAGNDAKAWGNIATVVIGLKTDSEHKIAFRMQEGDEMKHFTIFDIAYPVD